MAQPPEITAGGAQPYVGPDSPPLNLHKASNDIEEGAQLLVVPHLQQTNPQDTSNILGGSDAPFNATAVSATQPPEDIGLHRKYYRRLYLAAEKGDWKTAKSFIDGDQNALTARITANLETVLLIAARSCRWEFVLKLLELLSPKSVAVQNKFGFTALHYVAQAGSLRTAKALIEKNANLLHMVTNKGYMPINRSIFCENKELVWYFSLRTKIEYPLLSKVVHHLNQTHFLDVSLYFVRNYPQLALENETALLFWLASRPSHFFSGSRLGFFKTWIYKFVSVNIEEIPGSIEGSPALQSRSFLAQAFELFKRLLWKAISQLAPSIIVVRDMKLKHECAVELVNLVCNQLSSKPWEQVIEFLEKPNPILSIAVENGIEEIVSALLRHFPDLIYHRVKREPQRNILQAAIQYRQEKIVNVIKEISPIVTKNLCKELAPPVKLRVPGCTTFHLAGNLAPPFKLHSVSGAALQMQRELQWFKEVEKLTYPDQKEVKNWENKTATEVFWEAHQGLAVKGEKWMRDTANSSMVVSTLIATVLFAAAFTVPGGNVNDNGTPVFLWTNEFILFAISDAIGLFSSLTSLLMFLAILTARYAVDDFLKSLPKKLIIGLGSLFLAIAAMIVAFGATLTIILGERWNWVSVPITVLASFPVAIFVMLQLPLFIQMVQSTYGRSIFHAGPSRDFE